MSKQDLIKVVQRSINDAAFRRQLTTDTANAIRGYSLTPDEVGALRSRDSGKLTAFGVDTRMSKVFAIDQGALGSATITSESGAIGNAAVTGGGPRDAAPVWVGDGAAHGAIQTPDAAERNASITGSGTEPRDSDPVWIGDTAAPLDAHAAPIDGSPEADSTGDLSTGDGDLQQ